MANNKQTIKFEADITEFKTNIKNAEKSITSLNGQLKLNQAQLKGNSNDSNLLTQKMELLTQKYNEQARIIENYKVIIKTLNEEYIGQLKQTKALKSEYEQTAKNMGENSKEAEELAKKLAKQEKQENSLRETIEKTNNKLIQAETVQQNVKNAMDETNRLIETQSSKFVQNGESIQKAGDKIQTFEKNINSIGNKLSIVSAGIGALAIGTAKAAIDFETGFTGVIKTVDGTEEQIEGLRQGILELSTVLPSTAVEISGVAESAGQLGIQTDNVLDFTKTMIDLGNSTNMASEEAATQLARLANITQMSQKDFDKLGSVIVDLGNNLATTESEITEMGLRLAGAGHQIGLSEAQIMSFAGALSSVGIEAEAGGSAFSKVMVQMQLAVEKGGESLKDFAKVSGMSANEFQKAFKEEASSAIIAFIEGLGKAEEKGTTAIKVLDDMGISEVRLRDSLLRASGASDVFKKSLQIGNKAWKENTALTNEANKRYETTESQMKILKNEVTKLAIDFGKELLPCLTDIIKNSKPLLDIVAKGIKSFSSLDDETKQFILKIGALVLALRTSY